jgi:putative ABC transport system permease protein
VFLKQVGVLLRMNLLGIPQRLGLVCTTVIGVTCAVGVLVAMLAMGVGARRQALGDVRPDRVILLSKDALEPGQSNIPQSTAVLIPNLAGIRRDSRGNPIVVPEAQIFVWAREKATGTGVGFPITGAGAELTEYTPELHLTSGRMFRRGLRELIASNYCARVYHDFSVGDTRVIDGKDWHVVGNFNLGRSDGTCTVYADVDTVLSTFGRYDYNQVNVMLQSPSAFDALVHAIAASPSLQIRAEREAALAKADFAPVNGILDFVSYFIGTILAVAATIGAANSLYAVVDGRRRELATVRAVGFRGVPVIIATLIEAVLMALPGALIGVGLAWVFFNDRTASPFGFRFHLAVTPSLALLGVGWSLAIGLIGGLLPAVRAARVPVTVALRAT